jgi:hypothetical protein
MEAIETLEKFPDEVRAFGFDFSEQPELESGQTVSSATFGWQSADPLATALVFGPIGIGLDGIIQATIAQGRPATLYLVTCEVVTSAFAIIEIVGKLYVLNVSQL